jgi:hypothetical protein
MEQVILFVLIGVLFGWISAVTLQLRSMISHYRGLAKGSNDKNLEQILSEILQKTKHLEEENRQLKKSVESLKESTQYHMQKMGVVRYNPFANTGGEQSFILSLLDAVNNGIILTSLHNRGVTRWYIKRIIEGKSLDHELSDEEKEAIKHASVLKRGWSKTLMDMMK